MSFCSSRSCIFGAGFRLLFGGDVDAATLVELKMPDPVDGFAAASNAARAADTEPTFGRADCSAPASSARTVRRATSGGDKLLFGSDPAGVTPVRAEPAEGFLAGKMGGRAFGIGPLLIVPEDRAEHCLVGNGGGPFAVDGVADEVLFVDAFRCGRRGGSVPFAVDVVPFVEGREGSMGFADAVLPGGR